MRVAFFLSFYRGNTARGGIWRPNLFSSFSDGTNQLPPFQGCFNRGLFLFSPFYEGAARLVALGSFFYFKLESISHNLLSRAIDPSFTSPLEKR